MKLTIGHLYPDLLNLYGDRGNIQCMMKRSQWRGIEAETIEFTLEDTIDFSNLDIVLLGGGSDREQMIVCSQLRSIQKDFKEYEYNAYEIFERIYKGYIKDTKKQIERNSEFFNSINGVDEIYLFGLSFGDVDAPYFRHVFKICQQLKTINLNVFEAGQYDSIMTKLKEYGAKCDIKKWIVE